MPKVSQDYLNKKREMIVEAAYRVCLRKPVQMVNITDVIAETGMSQGAIYRYYASLDDILIDLVSKMRADYNIVDRLNEITSDPDAPFEETVFRVCDVLGEAMEKHLMDVQKINFDLVVLAINEPKRVSYIMENLKEKSIGNNEYLASVIFPRLVTACVKNGYKPKGDAEELAAYIGATYTGIEKYCIFSACYGNGGSVEKVEPKKLFRTFAKTIILLFGGQINE